MLKAIIINESDILNKKEYAIYKMLALYITTLVIDTIHTNDEKVTALIVTNKADELQEAIHNELVRGITILPAKGAYSRVESNMLYLVITRYELYDLERIISEVDPNAFTNLIQTSGIFGFFRRDNDPVSKLPDNEPENEENIQETR